MTAKARVLVLDAGRMGMNAGEEPTRGEASSRWVRWMFTRRLVPRVVLRHIILLAILAIVLYPILWMVASSFGPSAEVLSRIGLLRSPWLLGNYPVGWSVLPGISFGTIFINSLIIAAATVVGNVLSCTMAAYAFARLHFRFRAGLFAIVLVTIMIPYQVLIIPQYIVFHQIGWINTFLPLIVPAFGAVNGFYIFLMVQFIRSLPTELDEAAKIDGAGHGQIFLKIVVPLAAPAMATVAVFSFVSSWNDFLGPLLYLTSPSKFTVSLGLSTFINSGMTGGASELGPLFAMCVASLAPVVGVFLAAQRFLAEGIATKGLK